MAKPKEEDLFEESTMTFGEHLEELRDCLVRSVYGLVIAVVIGFLVGDRVVQLIKLPLERALESYCRDISERKADKLIQDYKDENRELPYTKAEVQEGLSQNMLPQIWYVRPADIESILGLKKTTESSDGTATVESAGSVTPKESINSTDSTKSDNPTKPTDTVNSSETDTPTRSDAARVASDPSVAEEAKEKEVDTTATPHATKSASETADVDSSKAQASSDSDEGLTPLFLWMRSQDDRRTHATALSAHEGFMIWMKASLITGLVLASPWIFWQLWSFIAAGLYAHEKRYVHVYLPFSIGLFLVGVLVAFFVVFPLVLNFLFKFNNSLGIEIDPRISEWLGFVLFLPLGFGISFQLPLIMLFLNRIGIFQASDYLAYWRVAVLVVFVIAGVVTPPDPYSMSLLALPLTGLYFGGILLCKYMPKGRSLLDPPLSNQD